MEANEADQIDLAASAHARWLVRLRSAIVSGSSEFRPDDVRGDRQCDFGKWLHSAFPPKLKGTASFEEIRAAHARFHQRAAEILTLALSGRRQEATEAMDAQGEFMQLSGALLLKLKALKKI
ncbi:MAG TPA: CZB domain-containing protein [Anaeromyxobacter sp.]|nr:CZB domain-containing protein [Anaeromyxobacter sp.]